MPQNQLSRLKQHLSHWLSNRNTNLLQTSDLTQLHLVCLEDRILYSAAPVPMDLVEYLDAHAAPLDDGVVLDSFTPATDVFQEAFQLSSAEFQELPGEEALDLSLSALPSMSIGSDRRFELVIVDATVDNYQTLVDAIIADIPDDSHFDIAVLDASSNGVEQISKWLAENNGEKRYNAVHLVTHGSDGVLNLGTTQVNGTNLIGFAGQLTGWQNGLTADADLLIYGCEVAQTSAGQAFLQELADLTGTDVAASNDVTGNTLLGGDWELEFLVGQVESQQVIDSETAQNWLETLGQLTTEDETLVNQVTNDEQITSLELRGSHDSVAMDANGNYVVVWSSKQNNNGDGSGFSVMARLFDVNGNPMCDEFLVNQSTSGDQINASVARADDGTFVVTWTDRFSNENVYFRRFAADGSALGNEALVNTTMDGSQSNSVIGMDRQTGDYVIAWQGKGLGDDKSIFFRRFLADGIPKDASERIATPVDVGDERDAAIAMLPGGGFVIAWEQADNDHIYFQQFDTDGNVFGGPTQIDNFLGTSFGIDVASDDAGNFTFVYREENILPGIWQRSFQADGSFLGSWSYVSSGDGTSPSIQKATDGSYVITWQESGDGDKNAVYAQKFDANRNPVGSKFVVNQSVSGDQSMPSVAVHDADNFVVVWSGEGSSDSQGVFSRQFGTATATPNNDPMADAGGPYAMNEGDSLTLDASGSNDPDGNSLDYQWDLDNDGIFGEAGEVLGSNPTLDWDTLALFGIGDDGNYTIGLRVDDGLGGFATTTVGLTVNNVAPTITSLATVVIPENSALALAVTANDPNDTVSFSIVGGPDAAAFTIDSATGQLTFNQRPNFELPSDVDGNHIYELQIGAFDGTEMVTQDVCIHIGNVTLGLFGNTVAENSPVGTIVGNIGVGLPNQVIDGSFMGSGRPANFTTLFQGDSIANWTVTQGAIDLLGSNFDSSPQGGNGIDLGGGISGSGGQPGAISQTLTTVIGQQYTVTFELSGGWYADSEEKHLRVAFDGDIQDITISKPVGWDAATDMKWQLQKLTFTAASVSTVLSFESLDAGGEGPIIADVSVMVDSATLTYELTDDAGGRFAIDPVTGQVTVADSSQLDFEQDTSHNIGVQVLANGAVLESSSFLIQVTDVNEASIGMVSDIDSATNSVVENSAVGTSVGIIANAGDLDSGDTVSYSLDDDAGGRFAIDSVTGVVTVIGAIDREAASSYNITIRATSTDTSFSTQTFTITIGDVDEFNVGAVSDTNATANAVNENAAIGTAVGITASANDADATSSAITYSLQDNDGGRFAIDSVTGVVTVAGAIDRETDGASRNITVQATSADGSFTDQVFTISIADVDEFDVGPVIDADATANAVKETAAIGTPVGITASASDADATNNTITYTLRDSDGGRFAIDANTGVVTLAAAIDRETDGATRNFIVRNTSADGSFIDQAFTISIADVDEFDVNAVNDSDAGANTVAENATVGTAVGITALASDADATTNALTYTLDDDAGGRFAINSSTGIVTVNAALDFETATSHDIQVRATSSDGSFFTQSFTVQVTNVNEAPVISSSKMVVYEGSMGNVVNSTTLNASDVDDAAGELIYTVQVATSHGKLILNGVPLAVGSTFTQQDIDDGRLTYNHDGGETTTDQVRLHLQDGLEDGVLTQNILLQIEITPVNDAPSIIALSNNSIDENSSIGSIVGQFQAIDPDDTDLLFELEDADGNSSNNPFAIDPLTGVITVANPALLDFETAASFEETLIVTDPHGVTTVQTFTISINPINEAPKWSEAPVTMIEGGTVSGDISQGASDPESDQLEYRLVSGPAHGVLQFNPDGRWTYTHNDTETFSDQFVAVVADEGGNETVATVKFQITPVDDSPLANDDFFTTDALEQLSSISSDILENDGHAKISTIVQIVEQPKLGMLVQNPDGSIKYTPHVLFQATDSFTYRIIVDDQISNEATVTIQIEDPVGGPGASAPITPPTTPGQVDNSSDTEGGESEVEDPATENTSHEQQDLGSDDTAVEPPLVGPRLNMQAGGESDLEGEPDEIAVKPESFAAGQWDRDESATDLDAQRKLLWQPRYAVYGSQIMAKAALESHDPNHLVLAGMSEHLVAATIGLSADFLEELDAPVIGGETLQFSDISMLTFSTSGLLTFGYLAWGIRAGALVSTFISLPAWSQFDPLPVIEKGIPGNLIEDDESLESLVDTA